jgi:hypothetical protein
MLMRLSNTVKKAEKADPPQPQLQFFDPSSNASDTPQSQLEN